MYLKSIEIQGFKSFANKIKFEFKEGITGIVGPNGSGKSNIADAVRWVFGEQSAKQLRGSNMQDVIFAGTQLRKPQSFAAVAITLDNSDRALALDFDEIIVERKVYRSGESEYIINGSQCRLRDVYELFYDTGIGKEGYSIIGQGQVDKILSGKPEERRELFDEAAGIVKYKKRKQVALKKLENERSNMLRLTDIISELEKQAGPLKRQSEVAKQYLKLRDELRSYDINAFLIDSETYSKQLAQTSTNLEIATKELAEKQEAIEALKSDYTDVDESISSLDEKLSQVRATIAERFSERSELETNIGVYKERIHTEESNIAHYDDRVRELDTEKESKGQQIEERTLADRENTEKRTALQAELDRQSGVLHELDTRINLYRNAIDESHGKEIDLLTKRSEIQAKLQEAVTFLSQVDVRMEEYQVRYSDLSSRSTQLDTEIKEAEKAVSKSAAALSDKQAEIDGSIAGIEETDAALSSEQRTLNDNLQKYQVEKSRVDTLRAMQERYEGFNAAVRKVMEIRKSYPGVCGTVADLLKTEAKYQTAIEVALGGNFQNIIVEKEDTAKKIITYLKENREGRATFLPIDAIRPTEGIRDQAVLGETGVLGTCDSFIQCDEKYRNIVKYLVGRFLLVDTVDHALAIARKYKYTLRLVTLEGEFLNAGGSISGGSFKNKGNVLNRTKELDALAKQAETYRKTADLAQKRVNQYRQMKASAQTELDDLREELDQLRVQDANLKAALDSKRRELTLITLELKENRTSINNLKKQQSEYQAEQAAIEKALADLEQISATSGDSSEETKALLDNALNERAPIRKAVEEMRLSVAQMLQGEEFSRNEIDRLKKEIEQAEADQVRLNEMIEEAKETITAHEEAIRELEASLQQMNESASGYDETLRLLTEEREKLAARQKEFFDKQDALSNTVNDLSKEEVRLQMQKERLEERLDALTDYLWHEYTLTPSEAAKFHDDALDDETPAQIRRRANELKSEIKALGNVNVNAIDSYAEVSERYEFMSAQYQDLQEAEKNLVGIIDDLDNGMRETFSEKFAQIEAEYDKVFKELFGGGQGVIRLDPDMDIIDADITIISQPPGKKLQNMMQLSGGEKALSAIALIFAIQNLKPSPFCILDEIEAALDDSNVGRFTGYLRKLTANTQFIVITHRRGTMVASDRLYGITMQEKGVSTLVSVSLVEKDLDA